MMAGIFGKKNWPGLILAGLLGLVLPAFAQESAGWNEARLEDALSEAGDLSRLHSLMIARNGEVVAERAYRGHRLDTPVNVKSVSKSVISALVGIAIDKGFLDGPDQRIAPILKDDIPDDPDPRLNDLTIGHLLSMRAGLERTSGRNYGRWVTSGNWVRHVLSRPFVDNPGGRMLYSTGNFHVLSAVLTKVTGRSTLALARAWLGDPLGVSVPAWQRDPQGIYFGGNNMALSPRALLRFGETYRQGGMFEGKRVLPADWVRTSWRPRARSPYSGDLYGFGWFITDLCGRPAYYARGFGGQLVYVVPSLDLTIAVTSDPMTRTRRGGYGRALRRVIENGIVAAALPARESDERRARAAGTVCGASLS